MSIFDKEWFAKPNDLIGGWCVMAIDETPAKADEPEVADFIDEETARYIADMHNDHLKRHQEVGEIKARLRAIEERE